MGSQNGFDNHSHLATKTQEKGFHAVAPTSRSGHLCSAFGAGACEGAGSSATSSSQGSFGPLGVISKTSIRQSFLGKGYQNRHICFMYKLPGQKKGTMIHPAKEGSSVSVFLFVRLNSDERPTPNLEIQSCLCAFLEPRAKMQDGPQGSHGLIRPTSTNDTRHKEKYREASVHDTCRFGHLVSKAQGRSEEKRGTLNERRSRLNRRLTLGQASFAVAVWQQCAQSEPACKTKDGDSHNFALRRHLPGMRPEQLLR